MEKNSLLVKDVFGSEHLLRPQRPQMGVEVSWIVREKIVKKEVVDPTQHALIACVSDNYEEVVIIYASLLGIELSHGAIIFSSDGSIKKKLEMPQLISLDYKTYEKKVGLSKAKEDLRFINCYFIKDADSEKLIMWVRFKSDFFEIREVDKNTGEFGQCLGVSKQ